MQLLAPFIPLFYCTKPCIHCLYTLSHIPQLSICITANGTYAQPGEESLFTEEPRSTPWESTRIDESSQSSFPIKCLPFSYLPLWIILRMTNIPNSVLTTDGGNPPADRILDAVSVLFGSRPAQKPNSHCPGGVVTRTRHKPVVFQLGWNRTTVPTLRIYSPLATSNYWSSHRMVTWSVRKLCSSSRSFASHFPICDPTDTCWVAVKNGQILNEISGFLRATERILVGSHIWDREVKEPLELHNLRTDHVIIQSELIYLIGGKVVTLKCRVVGVKTTHFQWAHYFMS